ncbi:MAG: hydantoinase/carbamoylase family amidase [Rhodovibrionaceae bacterium]|nr:hydantoinase/carbamoylase family amidase [Rhodovibrionaceae bacterium]
MSSDTTPEPDIELAEQLFSELDSATRDGRGIRRDSYGPGEDAAHEIVRNAGERLGLEIDRDAALNLYLTLPGKDRSLPAVFIGSHLDSVDQGGNFDGAAGVLAGLAVAAGFKNAGVQPERDITVMAIRCEEAHWFDGPYVGTNLAFGRLDPGYLDDLKRSDTGRTLADHMAECGGDVEALRRQEASLEPSKIAAYVELHIEQAPVLVEAELPIGLVTGIRGYRRYSSVRCTGVYGHSGALPRRSRADAVAASVHLIEELNREWVRLEEQEGRDLVFTVGQFSTDERYHGPSKVAGETSFSLDFRSIETQTLDHMMDVLEKTLRRTEHEYGVSFELGARSDSPPAVLSSKLRGAMKSLAKRDGIAAMEMASGAGHDAAVFAELGVPTAMIFVRNRQGSHNPDEEMEIADFREGVRLLASFIDAGEPALSGNLGREDQKEEFGQTA